MTKLTAEQRMAALKRKAAQASRQAQGANAGETLVGMMEAELVRQCILYLRMKTKTGPTVAETLQRIRGEIIGLSKAVLMVRLPYKRGDEEQRKRIVGKALREAKQTEADMAKRRSEAKLAKPKEFRVSDSGSLLVDITDIADKQIRDLNDMLIGEGNHKGHKARQVGRCVICSCGVRAQGRLKK
jgi:hypothetical protein